MNFDLPLNLPLKSDTQRVPAPQLQRAVIKALRIEYNWQSRSTRIRQLKKITCGNAIDQMQPLGSQWLITLSRSSLLTQIAVWDVRGSQCCRVASVDTSTALRFSADLRTQSEMIIAVIEHNDPRNEHLNIYSLCFAAGTDRHGPSAGSLEIIHSVSKPLTLGTFFDVHVCGHIVAAAVARFSGPTSPPEYEIILVNSSTHMQWVFDPKFPPGVERVPLKLSSGRIALVGVGNHNTLIIREFALPVGALKEGSGIAADSRAAYLPAGVDNSNMILLNHDAVQLPTGFDLHLSTDSANETATFMPILVFPSLVVATGGLAYTINFPLFPMTHKKEVARESLNTIWIPMQQFSTPAKTSADIICVGRTGRRAVWVQRRWDNDEFEFMKTTFSSSGEEVAVIPLFPKHTPLPFEPHACQSLAFDEASGRLYISVHTGELFALDL